VCPIFWLCSIHFYRVRLQVSVFLLFF
jgi:hypothetical protein